MAKVLIVYGTTEGHTRKIAQRAADAVREVGHEAEVQDSANLPVLDLSLFEAVILAGSLHQEKHQPSLVQFIADHRDSLAAMPTAFLSSSLTAVIRDEKHVAAARRCMEALYEQTGWRPTVDTPVAGALLYTKYDFLKRMLMRMISSKEGGATDTSEDYEYTDWEQLRQFVQEFLKTSARA